MIVEYKFRTHKQKRGCMVLCRRWHVWALLGIVPLYVRTWRE